MSDTVKLIIEIPKGAYKACIALKSDSDDGIVGLCAVNAIGNGIPLDDVKAEIEQGICTANNDYDKGRNYGLYMATQILDNIGKAEKTDERNCEICEHYKPDKRGNYSCEKWECDFKEMRELRDE